MGHRGLGGRDWGEGRKEVGTLNTNCCARLVCFWETINVLGLFFSFLLSGGFHLFHRFSEWHRPPGRGGCGGGEGGEETGTFSFSWAAKGADAEKAERQT